jgi:hypothetical protein
MNKMIIMSMPEISILGRVFGREGKELERQLIRFWKQ